MSNKFRPVDFDECPICGGDLSALTDEKLEEYNFYDGDEVHCLACKKQVGNMIADETAHVSFFEEYA